MSERKSDRKIEIVNSFEAIPSLVEQSKRRASGDERALSSPYDSLNSIVPHFYGGDLIVVAGRPSMGKSAFAAGLAFSFANQGENILFFSLEMSAQQIITRLLSTLSSISTSKISSGDLSGVEWERLEATKAEYEVALRSFYIVDSSYLSSMMMEEVVDEFKEQYGNLSAIFVDYLQLMSGSGGSEHREKDVSACSQAAKRVAREANVPLFLLSQLNRQVEYRGSKRPMLADLRESGAIEQDADIVMFLFRGEYYGIEDAVEGETEIIVAKNRSGATGTGRVYFDKARVCFT